LLYCLKIWQQLSYGNFTEGKAEAVIDARFSSFPFEKITREELLPD
jgi:hypothetical protein